MPQATGNVMQLQLRRLLFWFTISAVLAGVPLHSQTFGEITGHVSDPSGAPMAGAKVFLTSVATNAVRTTVTTGSGDYTFPALEPGFYNVRVEQASFKTANSSNVQVQVQQTVRLDFTLEVGQVNERVEVSASAEMLQAENVSLGTVIGNQGVTQLPLNGRNYLSLVALAANTNTLSASSGQAASRLGGDRASQSISAGGNRIMFDYFTLDGVANTDPDFSTYVVLPSIDAIQEFKVQTGVYPAEFGHESTQINVVTKSGGNAYHGALFEFLRNDKFDAVPYAFTATHPVKSPFKWNDYGFEIDGPVRIPKLLDLRNRLFFMANDEWKTQRQSSQAIYSVPTAAMFTGDFSALGTTIYDPATAVNGGTKTAFPGNRIPSSRIDPISRKFLNYYVPANLPGIANNYTQMNSSPNNRDEFTLRMDFVESAKSQWSGRYSWGDENQASTGISITGSKILTNYEQYLGTNTRTLSPTLVNEARFGYTRLSNSLGTYSAYNIDTVSALGIPNLQPGAPVAWGVPFVSFAGDGFNAIGDTQDGPYAINDNTLQAVDNVSWIRGKHTLRFGFEYNRQNFNQIGNQFSRGQFAFQPNATQSSSKTGGDAFAEFLLGDIYQSTVAVALANAKFQRNAVAAFIDDTWKITTRLTLSLGLRYELTPPWTDTLNNLFTVSVPHIYAVPHAPNTPYMLRQGNCTDPYAGPPPINIRWTTVSAECNNGTLPDQLMHTSYRDFAPRVGIAFSPNAKTVIRAGWGIFYNQDIANAYFDLARNIAGRVTLTSTPGVPSLFYGNAVPGGSSTVAKVPSPYAYAMAPSHNTTYAMQYLFNLQRQLTPNWALEAGYLGGASRHLQGFQDVNQAIPGTTGSVRSRMPFPGFSNIQYVQDGGNGDYNSLSLKLTRRFSQGVSVIGSYTWSKSIDTTSGIRNQGYDTLYPQNSYCLACERGLSAFDTRHRMVTSVLYDLPVGRGKLLNITNSVANAIIGGWQAGGILTLQTGMPGTLTIGGVDNASTGAGGYDRPDATGVSPYLNNPTPSRYWNLAAFTEAPPGQFGNAARNSIEGPGIIGFDAEVHKEFRMPYKEGHALQFRFEAFNVLNHPNWQMPNLNILAGVAQPGLPSTAAHENFGVVTATSIAMRQIQLGLKYVF
ncbi:MAG TPA: TonB-dependent receptor [Bryobacteraceae bacterium]|nr:TonB-dependent receptor [Bryobacteraceae bacterium]